MASLVSMTWKGEALFLTYLKKKIQSPLFNLVLAMVVLQQVWKGSIQQVAYKQMMQSDQKFWYLVLELQVNKKLSFLVRFI